MIKKANLALKLLFLVNIVLVDYLVLHKGELN